jgi:hypothetical protein
MRLRILALFVSLLLFFALAACSSKPVQNSSSAGNPAASGADNAGPTAASDSATKATKPEQGKAEAKPLVVPSGTVITVRLGNAVGSKISTPGQSFTATLTQPIKVDGNQVVPSGASASGTVVDAKPLGKFKGGALLKIKLVSININGTDQQVQTSSVTRTEKGKGKRTAVMAGGGAGLGALIGGLAGGGKGALIGAAAGGGAGTAGAAFTGNKEIVLPAESAVSFRLEEPLQLK